VHHGEFRDDRLVEVYDAQYGWSRDDDYFQAAVEERPASDVLDLGCGTGRLAIALAAAGHTVTGIDPAKASLAVARAKPGSDRVTWVCGDVRAASSAAFDTAVLTSHVAQFFVTDAQWRDTLADLGRVLRPGGRLAFDSRDPAARAWLAWNPENSAHRVTLPGGRAVDVCTEVTGVRDGVVAFEQRFRFDDGVERRSTAALRFRTEDELRTSLDAAGFTVDAIFGGWAREPVGQGDGELLVIARRR
jgi:SAM-dependent methyltransferase